MRAGRTVPLSTGYSWRTAEPADARAVHELFRSADDQAAVSLYDVHRDLTDRHGETMVVVDGGRLVGVALVRGFTTQRARQAQIRLEVDPGYAGLGIEDGLAAWLIERGEHITKALPGYGLPRVLRASASNDRAGLASLYERVGFRRVRYWDVMRRDLRDELPEPRTQPAVGYPVWTEQWEKTTKELYDSSFAQNWGYGEADLKDWRSRHTGDPAFRPDLSLMAFHEKVPAGFLLGYVDPEQNTGLRDAWIGQIGVHPDHRRLGIGSQLVLRAMQLFREHGLETATLEVDVDNPTKAGRMYLRLGFRAVRRLISFVREL